MGEEGGDWWGGVGYWSDSGRLVGGWETGGRVGDWREGGGF